MSSGLVAAVSIVIQAKVEEVWKALTDPRMIKLFLFGTDASSDWKPGSPITYRGSWEGQSYEDKGVVLEVLPNRRLTTSYWSAFSGLPDKSENYNTITWELTGEGGGTRLSLTQDNNPTEEGRAAAEANWRKVLGTLKELLET